jgi:hypothetical protein
MNILLNILKTDLKSLTNVNRYLDNVFTNYKFVLYIILNIIIM